MTDRRRITLVTRDPRMQQRDWDLTNPAGSHIIFVDSVAFLPYAIVRGFREDARDIERVIIDRNGSALQLVELIATLPPEFAGDVLFIDTNEKGFLSSRSRGDGRMLYAMQDSDIAFYLQTYSLTWPAVPGESRVTQFALA